MEEIRRDHHRGEPDQLVDELLRGDEGEHERLHLFRGHAFHARTRLFRGEAYVTTVHLSDEVLLAIKKIKIEFQESLVTLYSLQQH